MDKRELICIRCPLGCPMTVKMNGSEVAEVTGYTCERGNKYAIKEVTDPTRTVTSSVRVFGAASGAVTVSCKTRSDVPKAKIFDVVACLKGVAVAAPVRIGDVVLADAAGTGVDVIATKAVA